MKDEEKAKEELIRELGELRKQIAELEKVETERKKAEEALRESEEKLRNTFGSSPNGITVTDLKATIIDCNQATLDLHGFSSKEELIGKSAFDLIAPKDRQRALGNMKKTLKGGSVKNVEYIFLTRDGTEFPAELSASVIRDSAGRPSSLVAITKDITERKKAEEEVQESKSHFQTLFNVMVDPVVIVDEEGKILEVTNRVQEVAGFKREELLGKSFLRINIATAKNKAVLMRNLAARMRGMEIAPYEIGMLTKDGRKIALEVNAAKIKYRGKPAVMGVFRDLSGRKRAREEIQRTLKKLRKALGATIQALALTVEVRDAYTAGHQRRVTNLARTIATEMQLSERHIDGIRMAGAIHDLGKIAVPAEILNKPIPLADIEFALVKIHPVVGYNILKEMKFPWPVAKIVLQHHERMNGSGYPHGLSGEDILLEARILGVADVVEAMSSHRPYRPALGIDKALEEISKNKGILYDPQVVDTCLKLFTDKGFKFE